MGSKPRGRNGRFTRLHGPPLPTLRIWLVGTGWANRVSYTVMARALCVSRNTIAGIVGRHVRPGLWWLRCDERRGPVVVAQREPTWRGLPVGARGTWHDTHPRIFEPYARRKVRRARERLNEAVS